MNILSKYKDFVNENINPLDPYGEEDWNDKDHFEELTKYVEKLIDYYSDRFDMTLNKIEIERGGYGKRALRLRMKNINIIIISEVTNDAIAFSSSTKTNLSGQFGSYYPYGDPLNKKIRRKILEMGKELDGIEKYHPLYFQK